MDTVVKTEVIDRIVEYDDWSVQLDLEQFEGGRQRLCVYVYPDQGDSYPWELEVASIDDGLGLMGPFLDECRKRED